MFIHFVIIMKGFSSSAVWVLCNFFADSQNAIWRTCCGDGGGTNTVLAPPFSFLRNSSHYIFVIIPLTTFFARGMKLKAVMKTSHPTNKAVEMNHSNLNWIMYLFMYIDSVQNPRNIHWLILITL